MVWKENMTMHTQPDPASVRVSLPDMIDNLKPKSKKNNVPE